MRLADHVTLNFNNKMSTTAVFLDIEKAFDTTWHTGLLYKLAKMEFSVNLIKLISSFLSQRKVRFSVESELSTPRYMEAGVPQGSVLSPILYNLYINDTPQATNLHLALFADDTCLYATDRKEGYIVRKLQRGLDTLVALYSKPVCHVMSKAFSISKNTAVVDILLLKLRATWSASLIHCRVVL
jgi:hypothetical protein